jgi:predicted porin
MFQYKFYKSIVAAAIVGILAYVPVAQADEPWEFHLTPYLWAAGMDGTIGVAGRDVSVNASFSDLVDFVDTGGALRFEARKGRWGGFADYFGVTLNDEQTIATGTIRTESKQRIAEAGVTYRITEPTELLAGLRYQSLDNEINFPLLGRRSSSNSWTDGFVGARWTPVKTDKWAVWLRGDIGAGQSDLTWLATAGAGYRFNKTVGVLVAYRYLKTDYEDGDFKWDIAQKGLGLGVDFAW